MINSFCDSKKPKPQIMRAVGDGGGVQTLGVAEIGWPVKFMEYREKIKVNNTKMH